MSKRNCYRQLLDRPPTKPEKEWIDQHGADLPRLQRHPAEIRQADLAEGEWESYSWDPEILMTLAPLRDERLLRECVGKLEDDLDRRILVRWHDGWTQRQTGAAEGKSHQAISLRWHALLAKLVNLVPLYEGTDPWHPFVCEVRDKAERIYRRPHNVWQRPGVDCKLAQSLQRDQGGRFLMFVAIPEGFWD